MHAVRVEVTVDENGEVRLSQLPFRAGEHLEVIVFSRETARAQRTLRGAPIEYDRPTDPVAEEEWSALR